MKRLTLACAFALGTIPAFAAEITVRPPALGGFSVTNAAGDSVVFRVGELGQVTMPGTLGLASTSTSQSASILMGGTRFLSSFGVQNLALGLRSGNFTMTGASNVAIGEDAFSSNTTGGENAGVGYEALKSNTTGLRNTAFGRAALRANVDGAWNTAVGYLALFQLESGERNIALGTNAGHNLHTGDRNILIGSTGVDGESDTIRIGVSTHAKTFIAGIRGKTTAGSAIAVMIDGDGQLGTVSSSASTKDDIADMAGGTSDLMKLRPVTFHYKADQDPAGRTLQYGLVAEEVEQVYPGLVAHSPDGKVETVMYQFLPPMLLNEFQKQQRRIASLEGEVAEVATLRERLARLEHLLEKQR